MEKQTIKKLRTYTIHQALVIVLATAVIGCTNIQSEDYIATRTTADINQQKEDVKTTLVNIWDAIEKGDIERYASYIHPDFTQFGETDSILRIGKDVEVNAIKEWIKNSSSIHTEMEDPRVIIKGEVAWIVYYWSDSGTSNGKAFASRGKSTRIFVKEDGKWLCIHGHYTLLPSG